MKKYQISYTIIWEIFVAKNFRCRQRLRKLKAQNILNTQCEIYRNSSKNLAPLIIRQPLIKIRAKPPKFGKRISIFPLH